MVTLLDTLRDVVVMADPSGTVIYVNDTVESVLGWPAWMLVGGPLTAIIPTRLRDPHRTAFDSAMAGGPTTILGGPPIVVPALHQDGGEVEVELSLSLHNPEGEGQLVVAILRDISPRRRLERAESLTRYVALSAEVARRIALVDDIHSVHDAGEIILSTSGSMLGWDAAVLWTVHDDQTASPVASWAHSTLRDAMADLADPDIRFEAGRGLPGRVVASRVPQWVEDVSTDADFPRHLVAAQHGVTTAFAFPILGAGRVMAVVELLQRSQTPVDAALLGIAGQIGGSVGQFLERRMAADELAASKARKAAMLDSAFDAVVSMDHQGQIIEWNSAATSTFGHDATEAIGQPLADVIIPRNMRQAHRDGVAHHLRTGESSILGHAVELTALRKGGAKIPVEVAITRLEGVEPPEFIGFLRDISARKRAERELSENQERLREMVAVLQESLLPTALPNVPGLDVGASYRPAGDGTIIGGDFYDLVHVDGGRWAAFIGDVCGKGAEAARVTSLVRYTLRTTAMQQDDPVEAVGRCNDAVLAHRPNRFCTAVYLEIDVGSPTTVRVVRAGHPHPIVLRADGRVQPVPGDGTVLGVIDDPTLEVVPVQLDPGDALVLYTDGVIEARVGEDFLGDAGLRTLLRDAAGMGAQALADHLHDQAVALQGDHTRDDIAVLVLRQPPV